MVAADSCFKLFSHTLRRPDSRAMLTAGSNRPTNMPMIVITTRSSTSVKPCRGRFISAPLCSKKRPIAMLSHFEGSGKRKGRERRAGSREIRNTNLEIRNKFETRMINDRNGTDLPVLVIGASPFRFVSDLRFRVFPAFAHAAGDGKGHFQGLFVVQPRIDLAGIGPSEVVLAQSPSAADAFGNVFTGQFDMHPPEDRSEIVVDVEGLVELVEDIVKRAGFHPRLRDQGIAMHRVAAPGDVAP